jgi:hypothetical protein
LCCISQIGATTSELDFDAPRVVGDTLQAVAQLVAEGKELGISSGSVSGRSGSTESSQEGSKPITMTATATTVADLGSLRDVLTEEKGITTPSLATTTTSRHVAGATAAQDAKADAIAAAAIEVASGAGTLSLASTLSSDVAHEQRMALISSAMTEASYVRDCEQNQLYVPLAIFRYT